MNRSVIFVFCLSIVFDKAMSVCWFQSPFRSSTWMDSTRGTLTFTTTEVSNWGVTILNQARTIWQCVDNSSDTTIVMRTKNSVTYSTLKFYAYACLSLTNITENSYSYVLQYDQQRNAAYERLYVSRDDSITNVSTICNSSADIPTLDFHVLVKQGMGASAAISFPDKLLVSADYYYYDNDNNYACNDTKDKMDMCSNNTELTFNYSTCSQEIAYSAGGALWCVATKSLGSYDCAVVLNQDSTVGGTTSRFACLCSDGSSVSVVSGNCTAYQTATDFPTDADGVTAIGYKLELETIYVTCVPGSTTTSGTSEAGLSAGAIVGIVLAVIIVIAIVIVIIVLYKRGLCTTICSKVPRLAALRNKLCPCCKDQVEPEAEKPFIGNGVAHATTIDETARPPKLSKEKTMMSAITMTSSLAANREKSEVDKSLIQIELKSERSSAMTVKPPDTGKVSPRLQLFGKDLSFLVCCPKSDDKTKTIHVAEAPGKDGAGEKKTTKEGGKKGAKTGKGKKDKKEKKEESAKKKGPEKTKTTSAENGELTRAPTKMDTDLHLTSTPLPGGEKGVKGVVSVPKGLEKPEDRKTGWTFLACCNGSKSTAVEEPGQAGDKADGTKKKGGKKPGPKGKGTPAKKGAKKGAKTDGKEKEKEKEKKPDVKVNDTIVEDLTEPPPQPVLRSKTLPEREKTVLSLKDAEKVKVDVYVPDEKTKIKLKDTVAAVNGSPQKSKSDVGMTRPASVKQKGKAKEKHAGKGKPKGAGKDKKGAGKKKKK